MSASLREETGDRPLTGPGGPVRVLVTGGTSGLGLAMASALAQAGAAVALTGRSGPRAQAVAADLSGAIGVELDVRDESSVTRAVDEAWSRLGGIDMLANNAGIASTMHRARFVPYGPSRAGSEALSRIMAADLRDTGVTVNLLLPGGATVTGMLPLDAVPEGRAFLDAAVMGPPVVWLASEDASGVHDERIVATDFAHWLRDRTTERRS
ncbi:SDR family NAD(P)-dependent oxidoreductase [Micromonospora chersina]|uniref:SDR family NAD(P)-dependent oxidoreductase n=1 Tax=Micromonospora chersina TaxID=47854 RepID=UPI003D8C690F